MATNEEIIREFIASWRTLDAKKIASYFTDDGTYHNMPIDPVSGRDNVEAFIEGFVKDWTSTEWDIISLLADGDVVMVERLDRTQVGDKPVHLPCFGFFKMRDGKIEMWRDYFDMGTYVNALA